MAMKFLSGNITQRAFIGAASSPKAWTFPIPFARRIAQLLCANTGRIPTTLVVGVPLVQTGSQTVQAGWYGVRGSTVIIDSPATLTAILD
jgi:hypothetical protein